MLIDKRGLLRGDEDGNRRSKLLRDDEAGVQQRGDILWVKDSEGRTIRLHQNRLYTDAVPDGPEAAWSCTLKDDNHVTVVDTGPFTYEREAWAAAVDELSRKNLWLGSVVGGE